MGLNIVVGLAGLLDLGYAAFFAIGVVHLRLSAASPFSGLRPAVLADARRRRRRRRRSSASLLGAPTLRLRGDYLAIVTLGFGEIVPVVFLNADTCTRGHERHRRHLPAGAAAGPRRVQPR